MSNEWWRNSCYEHIARSIIIDIINTLINLASIFINLNVIILFQTCFWTPSFQDRGVDLSFDMVKKENFDSSSEGERKVKTEKCDLRVKSEFKSDSNQQSASSKLGGGRLKFFKGKFPVLNYMFPFWPQTVSSRKRSLRKP